MKTININGQDYKVKQTIRALFLWEQIADRQFDIKTTLDNYLYFYCLLLANNPDCPLSWDDFLDALDEDPTLVVRFGEILMDAQKRDAIFDGKDKEGKKKD